MTRANPHSTARADESCDDCGSFHGGYSAASMTLNGATLPVFDVEYARKELGYSAFMAMLEPSAPRWGQRGRRRLRKARLLARMANETIQRIRNALTIPRSPAPGRRLREWRRRWTS